VRILFLGAAFSQMPPIVRANEMGFEVFTTDNRPANPGHALAQRTFSTSTDDTEALWDLVVGHRIDHVVCYASDVGCRAANTIAQRLGNVHSPDIAIERLTSKLQFREFLNASGLQPLPFVRLTPDTAPHDFPAIVKPVDASGSKGITIVQRREELHDAYEAALAFSRSKQVIAESYLPKTGRQICGDGYFDAGRVEYIGFGDGWFHDRPGAPAPYAESFPCTQSEPVLLHARRKIEMILRESGFVRGTFNLDVINVEGEPFVIEIAPRSGGNFIPDVLLLYSGTDLIEASILAGVRRDFRLTVGEPRGCYANYMIHTFDRGRFAGIEISDWLKRRIRVQRLFVAAGEDVHPFTHGSHALGHLILEFENAWEMHDALERMHEHVSVSVTPREALTPQG